MKIAILGAGRVGSSLARNLSNNNYEVSIVDEDKDKIDVLQEKLDIGCVVGHAAHQDSFKKLGIDALDDKLSEDYLFNKFKNSQVLIKQLLLNQYIVAGIGNIYACEILYDAKISPLRKGRSLKKSQIGTILKSSRRILRKAIKYGGSSINDYVSPDGVLGNFQKNFKVYGRAGYKIKGCEIKKVVLHGRSTFFCPDIQK